MASPPSFTTLPFEIREMIYDLVYTCKHVETQDWDRKYVLFEGSHQSRVDPQELLALLSVNHQVSFEAAANFFGKRTFGGQTQSLVAFLSGIGPQRQSLLRSVIWRDSMTPIYFASTKRPCTPSLLFDLLATTNIAHFEYFTRANDFAEASSKLIDDGIMQLSGRMEVVVHVSHGFVSAKNVPVVSETTWRCKQNQLGWRLEENTFER